MNDSLSFPPAPEVPQLSAIVVVVLFKVLLGFRETFAKLSRWQKGNQKKAAVSKTRVNEAHIHRNVSRFSIAKRFLSG
jgi:hypothetical protein